MKTFAKIGFGCLAVVILAGAALLGVVWLIRGASDLGAQAERETAVASLTEADYLKDPQSGYARLSEDEKKIYAMFKKAADDYNPRVSVSGLGLTREAMDSRVWPAFFKDNPDVFWISAYSYEYDGSTDIIESVQFVYTRDKEQRDREQTAIDARVAEIKALIPENADTYTKVKIVHDAIVSSTHYAVSPDDQNIVSVLVNGQSVCAGYSKTMAYILKDLGVFCATIDGTAVGRGPHEWNIVKIDDAYYYIDATWDDPEFIDGTTSKDYIEHTYLNITTDELLKNHVIEETLPDPAVCTAVRDNYFIREGKYFDETTIGGFSTGVDQAYLSGAGSYEAKFSDPALIPLALESAVNGVVGYSGLRYLTNEDMGVVTVLF